MMAMTKTALVLAMMVATGCAGTFGGPSRTRPLAWHDHANRVGAVLTVASMACDFGGTEQAALDGWSYGRQEGGMPAHAVMGGTPSPVVVGVYFAGSTAILLAAAQVIPEKWRPLVYGAIVAVEGTVIVNNVSTTRGICGLSGDRIEMPTASVGRAR